jgi:hypothetical protein
MIESLRHVRLEYFLAFFVVCIVTGAVIYSDEDNTGIKREIESKVLEEKLAIYKSVEPKEGFVPDEETAIAIAKAVWKPIYGNLDEEYGEYEGVLFKDSIWRVRVPAISKGLLKIDGGSPWAEIRKTDGKILRVFFTR